MKPLSIPREQLFRNNYMRSNDCIMCMQYLQWHSSLVVKRIDRNMSCANNNCPKWIVSGPVFLPMTPQLILPPTISFLPLISAFSHCKDVLQRSFRYFSKIQIPDWIMNQILFFSRRAKQQCVVKYLNLSQTSLCM